MERRFDICSCGGGQRFRHTTHGRADRSHQRDQPIHHAKRARQADTLRGTRDEWDQLAENLNSMLERIETLMVEVKQVSDNVAHDLRTPLTRMRGRLEKAYTRQRNGDYDQSLIDDTMADLDAVLHMFSSLTRISQIEAGDPTSPFRTANFSENASEVVGRIYCPP